MPDVLQKGYNLHAVKTGLNTDKFAAFWIQFTKRFNRSFVLQITLKHSLTYTL